MAKLFTIPVIPRLKNTSRQRKPDMRYVEGQRVLVVSHKATIRLLLSSLLGFDPRRYRDNLDQSPAALNVVDFSDPSRARLTLFNDTSHVEADGRAIPAEPGPRLSPWWGERAKD